jgi:hypothetical protein
MVGYFFRKESVWLALTARMLSAAPPCVKERFTASTTAAKLGLAAVSAAVKCDTMDAEPFTALTPTLIACPCMKVLVAVEAANPNP